MSRPAAHLRKVLKALFTVCLGLFSLGYGGFELASLLASPKDSGVGQVQDLTKRRPRRSFFYEYKVTLRVNEHLSEPLRVGGPVYDNLVRGDKVRATFRRWDHKATRVEVLEGKLPGWTWDRSVVGELPAMVFWLGLGGLLLYAGLTGLQKRRNRPKPEPL